LGTLTMNNPRHENTYSDCMRVGRRDNWLIGWQAKEGATVGGSYR
jgi:hypothetical protein